VKRIFYYSGYRLTVYQWQKNRYLGGASFIPDEGGLDKFRNYLQETENTPARIMVDVIEEDYKKEIVPHVNSKDRKAIIERTIERQYRKSKDYIYHRVMGREDGVRKQDKVLCSVLTNPGMLEPWLKVIAETETAIAGIWSVPLISEHLIKELGVHDVNLILVTQQVPSVIRLSYFKNGKFEISRTARVSADDTPLGLSIAMETEQTLSYLSNQRYIGFDEKVTINIIIGEEVIDTVKTFCIDTPLRVYKYQTLESVQKKIGCGGVAIDNCGGIYSFICKKQKIPKGHYGPQSLFKYYYQKLASNALSLSSVFMLLVSVLVLFSFISEVQLMQQETELLEKQSLVMENRYNRELLDMEPVLEQTEAMKSSVLLHNKIVKTKRMSPQNFMTEMSRIFILSGMNDTEITEIEWRSTQASGFKQASTRIKKKINYAAAIEIKQFAIIRGFIRVSQSSLKESIEKVKSITDALKGNKWVEGVEIGKMPLDVRSKSSIQNESRAKEDDVVSSDEEKGKFEIYLIMKGRQS
jgi:hypothetical protein